MSGDQATPDELPDEDPAIANADLVAPAGDEFDAGASAVDRTSSTLDVFRDLKAPQPVKAAPSTSVRWMAFLATIAGGLLGALVGFGIGDVMTNESIWAAVGALLGGITGAVGLGILANLTLRAMNEWQVAQHPEAGPVSSKERRRADRQWTKRPSA